MTYVSFSTIQAAVPKTATRSAACLAPLATSSWGKLVPREAVKQQPLALLTVMLHRVMQPFARATSIRTEGSKDGSIEFYKSSIRVS